MGYIYLGEYYHKAGKELNLSEKKIGKTINLDQREHELGRTNSPIGYTYINAWDTGDDTDKVERQIHALLGHDRMEGTEWFEDKADDLNDRLSTFMDYGSYKEVELADEEDEQANVVRKVSLDKVRSRALKDKLNEYLEGESFSFPRKKVDLNTTITIKADGIYSDTTDKTYTGKQNTPNYAFEDSFREWAITELKINPDRDTHYWYDKENEWGRHGDGLWRKYWEPLPKSGWNAKNKDGKSIMQRLLEVEEEKKQ